MESKGKDAWEKWHCKVECLKLAHFESSIYYGLLNNSLGVLLITSSALVGTFSTLELRGGTFGYDWKLLVIMFGLISAVLASLQLFFRFSERAERHRQTASNYARLEMMLDIRRFEPDAASVEININDVLTEWAWLTSGGPVIPNRIYRKYCGYLDVQSRRKDCC